VLQYRFWNPNKVLYDCVPLVARFTTSTTTIALTSDNV